MFKESIGFLSPISRQISSGILNDFLLHQFDCVVACSRSEGHI